MNGLVTIVTVSLNARADLQKTLTSVAAQEHCNVEHVIVDGASTDGTPDFLASLRDPRVRWISEPDSGIYEAMNKAVMLAKGEYLLALNAGDTFVSGKSLAGALRYLDGESDIIAFDVLPSGAGKHAKHTHESLMRRLGLKIPYPHQGCFIRRDLFARIGMYDETYRVAADYEFELRAVRSRCAVKRIPATLTCMPMGGISTRTDSISVRKRFSEERRVQFAHSPNAAYTLFLLGFWPMYLTYRGARRLVAVRQEA